MMKVLDKLYDAYMDNDSLNLLHEEFDYMIEDLRGQGQIKDLLYVREEKDNLINIVGNIVGEVDVIERENKNGETFKVANFSVVSKDDEGNKLYHNCSVYGEKSDIPKDFKQGDFVKLFGQIWTIVNKKDTIFKYIFWERLDSLPIPECCFHFVWCQIA